MWVDRLEADQVIDHCLEARAWRDGEAFDQCCLGSVRLGYEDALETHPAKPERGDKNSVDVAHGPVQRELTDEGCARRRFLARARERDGDGDRQVEGASVLAHLGR